MRLFSFEKNKPLSVVLILLIIFLIIFFMFNFFKKQSEVVEVRDFLCPDAVGCTLKYPIFKNWEAMEVREVVERAAPGKEYEIVFKGPKEQTARASFVFEAINLLENEVEKLKNSNGATYVKFVDFSNGKLHSVIFPLDEEKQLAVTIFRYSPKEDGFSNENFFKILIESFKNVE